MLGHHWVHLAAINHHPGTEDYPATVAAVKLVFAAPCNAASSPDSPKIQAGALLKVFYCSSMLSPCSHASLGAGATPYFLARNAKTMTLSARANGS